MIARKDGVVKKLTGGVSQLLKGNKVTFYHGKGTLKAARQLEVTRLMAVTAFNSKPAT